MIVSFIVGNLETLYLQSKESTSLVYVVKSHANQYGTVLIVCK